MGSRTLWGVWGLPLLALLAGAAAVQVGGLSQATPSMPPRAPESRVRERTLASADHGARLFLGVIVASESVDLTAPLEGRIESIRVQPGDRIRRGEIVATLDPL